MNENNLLSVQGIKRYSITLEVEDNLGNIHTVYFDGLQGTLSREDWREDFDMFTKEGQDEILDALENTSNGCFFAED